jgi:hypothetical protein
MGVTNLGVIVAGKNKYMFPANAPKEMAFYILIMLIHFMLLAMVFYTMLDHSILIRETESTREMVIFTIGFVLTSTLILGFIVLHCSMLCLLVGVFVIYYLFCQKNYPFTLWLISFVAAIFLIAFVPTVINSIFEVKEAGAKKEL